MDVTFRPIVFNGQTPADETISASTEDRFIRVEGTIHLMSTCRFLGGTLEAVGVDLIVRLPYDPQAGVKETCTSEAAFVGYTVVIRELPAAKYSSQGHPRVRGRPVRRREGCTRGNTGGGRYALGARSSR